MFTMHMPDLPNQYAQVMVAQTTRQTTHGKGHELAMGFCMPIDGNFPGVDVGDYLEPQGSASDYFFNYKNKRVPVPPASSVTVLTPPGMAH